MNRIHYPEDCLRIQRILLKRGYEATLLECQRLWEFHSRDMNANWLMLPPEDRDRDDAIYECVREWFPNDNWIER